MIDIGPLHAEDRAAWEQLARGYKEFYATEVPEEGYERTWRRLRDETSGVHGIGARADGRLIGIAHYLFHGTVWTTDDSCYLQDLFVARSARGHGAARALIAGVAEAARDQGAERLYWTTQEHNTTARALYDKVAVFRGFIRYDHPMPGTAPQPR